MDRLTYWNNKEKGSALPAAINDNGDTVDLETLCVKLAAYEDTRLEPSEIPTGFELANVFAALQELKRYEDAEEQGLLVRLPCKVGDTVYTNKTWSGDYERSKEKPYCHKVVFVGLNGEKDFFNTVNIKTERMFCFDFADIGKTLFLTREAALVEMTDTAK